MRNRAGFTLMELLLVVAILAVIAAVAAPQFFRSSDVAMTDARIALLKSNYSAIRAALSQCMWDDMNNRNIPVADRLENAAARGSFLVANSAIKLLVKRGYLQENQCFCENAKGEKLMLGCSTWVSTPDSPYGGTNGIASSPVFMEKTKVWGVTVHRTNGAEIPMTAGTYGHIDETLRYGGYTFVEVWNTIKDVPGLQ